MPQPVLRTARLVLEPLADRHLDLEVALDADPEVMRYLTGRARTREEVIVAHGVRMSQGRRVDGLGLWMVFTADRECVGLVMLPPDGTPGVAELGYRIARRFWRQGYAGEASLRLLRHGFETVGLARVLATTMAVNAGSRAVMAHVGMRYVRTYHEKFDEPLPGSERGEVEYAITREEWRSGR